MAGFIEDDSQSDSSGRHGSDSDDGERRQKKRRDKKRKAAMQAQKPKGPGRTGFGPRTAGISAEAWQEVTDVFGDGTDYADALDGPVNGNEDRDKGLKDVHLCLLD